MADGGEDELINSTSDVGDEVLMILAAMVVLFDFVVPLKRSTMVTESDDDEDAMLVMSTTAATADRFGEGRFETEKPNEVRSTTVAARGDCCCRLDLLLSLLIVPVKIMPSLPRMFAGVLCFIMLLLCSVFFCFTLSGRVPPKKLIGAFPKFMLLHPK